MAVITLPVEKKSFPIWREQRLHLDAWNSGGSIRGTATVSFTNLISAKVITVVTAQVWPSWASLWLNGQKIQEYDFRLGSGQVTQAIDVAGIIVNGSNEFSFQVGKVSWVGWGDYIITVDLEIEAEKASVSPPAPWETWPSWWPYAAIGVGLAGIGVYMVIRKKR